MKNKLIIIFSTMWFFSGCATTSTGRSQLKLMPDGKMNEMGTSAFDQMKQQTPIEHNTSINSYVKCIALAVAGEASDSTGVKNWEVVVFKDASANAFALPGGKIGVHTGILQVAKTAGQLAAVLGHEVGHVIARHGNERVSQAMVAQGGLALAGAAIDNKYMMAALGIGTQGVLLKYSRTNESESDKIGLDLAARAGFDPREAVQLWKNMGEASGGKQPPQFISTHPSHETRISDLESNMGWAMEKYNQARTNGGKNPDCKAFK